MKMRLVENSKTVAIVLSIKSLLHITEKTGAYLGGGFGGVRTTLCTIMSLNVQIPAQ